MRNRLTWENNEPHIWVEADTPIVFSKYNVASSKKATWMFHSINYDGFVDFAVKYKGYTSSASHTRFLTLKSGRKISNKGMWTCGAGKHNQMFSDNHCVLVSITPSGQRHYMLVARLRVIFSDNVWLGWANVDGHINYYPYVVQPRPVDAIVPERLECIRAHKCLLCCAQINPFKNKICAMDYLITSMCGGCQDVFYGS